MYTFPNLINRIITHFNKNLENNGISSHDGYEYIIKNVYFDEFLNKKRGRN